MLELFGVFILSLCFQIDCKGLRILGNGELTKAVTVKANHFTASAKEKIEKAGGKAELV